MYLQQGQPIEVPVRGGVVLIHPRGPAYSAMKNVEPAGAAGSCSMPKSRGRKPKKPRAPTKGAPKQLIAHNTPPREPPIPAQTVQQEPSLSPQTVQQESSIPRQTLLQSILKWTMKSVKRAWVLPRLFGRCQEMPRRPAIPPGGGFDTIGRPRNG